MRTLVVTGRPLWVRRNGYIERGLGGEREGGKGVGGERGSADGAECGLPVIDGRCGGVDQ